MYKQDYSKINLRCLEYWPRYVNVLNCLNLVNFLTKHIKLTPINGRLKEHLQVEVEEQNSGKSAAMLLRNLIGKHIPVKYNLCLYVGYFVQKDQRADLI